MDNPNVPTRPRPSGEGDLPGKQGGENHPVGPIPASGEVKTTQRPTRASPDLPGKRGGENHPRPRGEVEVTGRRWGEPVQGRGVRLWGAIRLPVVGRGTQPTETLATICCVPRVVIALNVVGVKGLNRYERAPGGASAASPRTPADDSPLRVAGTSGDGPRRGCSLSGMRMGHD